MLRMLEAAFILALVGASIWACHLACLLVESHLSGLDALMP